MATSVDVVDRSGVKVGTVTLADEWFATDVNIPAMHQVVTAQLAAARQGTHKTKTRAEVSGGGRKPWKQKGSGRARQGSTRSPQWVGGGVAHGRTPKDWSVRVNKKLRRVALSSALTDRAANSRIAVVRELTFVEPKTRDAAALLAALSHSGRVLVVLSDLDHPTMKSFRNIEGVHVLVVDQLNTHDIVVSDYVVFDEAALPLIGTGRRSSEEVTA